MDSIPNIITEKDYIYLKDLFIKNYNIFNMINEILLKIKNKEVRELFERIKNMHEDHMYFIIASLRLENFFDGDYDE